MLNNGSGRGSSASMKRMFAVTVGIYGTDCDQPRTLGGIHSSFRAMRRSRSEREIIGSKGVEGDSHAALKRKR